MKTTIKSALLFLCLIAVTGCKKENCDLGCANIKSKMTSLITKYNGRLNNGTISVDEYESLVNAAIDQANREGDSLPKYCDCWVHVDHI